MTRLTDDRIEEVQRLLAYDPPPVLTIITQLVAIVAEQQQRIAYLETPSDAGDLPPARELTTQEQLEESRRRSATASLELMMKTSRPKPPRPGEQRGESPAPATPTETIEEE